MQVFVCCTGPVGNLEGCLNISEYLLGASVAHESGSMSNINEVSYDSLTQPHHCQQQNQEPRSTNGCLASQSTPYKQLFPQEVLAILTGHLF